MRAGQRKFQTARWCLGVSLCLCAGFAAPAWAQGPDAPLTAQERLDAIRQSLVEASLQTPTKVLTTSWIDAQGSLRESSSFKNGMEVRGVRVLAYGRDESGQAKARLLSPAPTPTAVASTDSAPAESGFKALLAKLKQSMAVNEAPVPQAPSCKPQLIAPLKHLVSLELNMDRSANPIVLQALVPMVQSQWVLHNAPQGKQQAWRAVNSMPQASMAQQMTPYERALIGNRPASLPWLATLKISTEPTPAKGFEGYAGYQAPGVALHLDFQIMGTEGQTAKFEDHANLTFDLDRPQWSAARLNAETVDMLQTQIDQWRAKAAEWLNCQPLQPTVTAVAGQQLQINAGTLAGVKKGDEWIVAHPARFPAELASKDGAPQTLLATVQAVTPYSAQLLVLAGPAKAAQVEWRAWPTESLMKSTPP